MRKMILTAVAVAAVAVSAQAQVQYLMGGMAYVFTGTAATGDGAITYQWYRNGESISGATDQSYTLPEDLAHGRNVEFKRRAVSNTCLYNALYTDVVVITFCDGAIVGSLCWARTNVDDYQTFAVRPDMYTKFFQWNRPTAWAATGSISGWNSTADNSSTWTINPCPSGWRLPTREEFIALNGVGSTWAADNSARGNAVAGRFFGANHANAVANCTLPNNMNNCIFLPAVGNRQPNAGTLDSQGSAGRYWSSIQYSDGYAYALNFSSSSSILDNNLGKTNGRAIRCVQ